MSILLVIPCYNEASRLDLAVFEAALTHNLRLNLLFVDDGSNDKTFDILSALKSKYAGRWDVLRLSRNLGKAEAVRAGVLYAGLQYSYIGYWDADLSTSFDEIPAMLAKLERGKLLVMASRWKRLGAEVKRSELRHYIGRVFATMASNILRLPVYDSQCGAKLFKAEVTVLFKEPFITRWLFDVELLARMRNQYGRNLILERVEEHPVQKWIEKGNSRIRFSDMLRVPLDLLRISRKYNS
jgi:dolichyl-phosphate beta-glucosyltransferase